MSIEFMDIIRERVLNKMITITIITTIIILLL